MPQSKLRDLCKSLSRVTNSSVLAIIIPQEPLRPNHLIKIQKVICSENCNKLSVILHCGGGDINVAYQIVELLRNHCKHLITIVPLFAKSAAALFILGSNKIMMGEIAEFGPLDTQMPERKKGSIEFTSALNPFKLCRSYEDLHLKPLI